MPNYVTPPTAVAGFGLAASDWNTKVRDSLEDVAKPKRCKVNRNAVQSIPTGVSTAVNFTTEELDSDNMWVVSSPAIVTVPVAGLYLCVFTGQWSINAAGSRFFGVTKSGTVIAAANGVGSAAWYIGATVTALAMCLPGDTIGVLAYQTSGAALNIDHSSHPVSLSVVQLSR